MIKDELNAMEKYIQETEALQNYPQLKAERNVLLTENIKLKEKVEQLTVQGKTDFSNRQELAAELSKKDTEVSELSRRAVAAEQELSSLRDLRVILPDGGSFTLREMQEQFLNAQANEIETIVSQRVSELKKEMYSQLPDLVEKKFSKTLQSLNWPPEIQKAVTSQTIRITDETLRDKQKWPDWFKDYFDQQLKEAVDKYLDVEFENRMQMTANDKVEAMKSSKWEQYSTTKVRELTVSLKAMVNQLQGTRWWTCDQCGQRITLEIGLSEIGQLLRGITLYVTCPSCTNIDFSSIPPVVQHKIAVITFENLLQGYYGKSPPSD